MKNFNNVKKGDRFKVVDDIKVYHGFRIGEEVVCGHIKDSERDLGMEGLITPNGSLVCNNGQLFQLMQPCNLEPITK